MKLIIGLGNPGRDYEGTRHNAGFIVLDEVAKEFGAHAFSYEKKFDAEIAEIRKGKEKIILAKPQPFMNLSGESVKKIMGYYKIPAENIIIFHDDLDINLGSYKISQDSSAAGHNGVQSIFDTLGTQKIRRVRIGIEGSEKRKGRLMSGSDFVLQHFSENELDQIQAVSKEIFQTVIA